MNKKTKKYQDYDPDALAEAATYLSGKTNDISAMKNTHQIRLYDYDDELRRSYLSTEELTLLSILKTRYS